MEPLHRVSYMIADHRSNGTYTAFRYAIRFSALHAFAHMPSERKLSRPASVRLASIRTCAASTPSLRRPRATPPAYALGYKTILM